LEIPLVKNETSIKGDRKCHKVDIFCKSNEPPKITAYNMNCNKNLLTDGMPKSMSLNIN
jgi:hypothetical protein